MTTRLLSLIKDTAQSVGVNKELFYQQICEDQLILKRPICTGICREVVIVYFGAVDKWTGCSRTICFGNTVGHGKGFLCIQNNREYIFTSESVDKIIGELIDKERLGVSLMNE